MIRTSASLRKFRYSRAADDGDRRAQLVAGIGRELPFALQQLADALGIAVERTGQGADLAVRVVVAEAPGQVLGPPLGHLPCQCHHR